jgi:hypothetical protein
MHFRVYWTEKEKQVFFLWIFNWWKTLTWLREGKFLFIALIIVRISLNMIVRQMR